jgi:hypothetical protein
LRDYLDLHGFILGVFYGRDREAPTVQQPKSKG